MTAITFRILGLLFLIAGIPLRFNPRIVLPQFYEVTGGFEKSPAGQTYFAFIDLTNMLVFMGALLVVISFTTLVASRPSRNEKEPSS